ncbi:clp protease adapter protein ClpF, chloroplastic [Aplysia californica]|uniref:Clp protease adapter protein ClpF, chloroplastic n=1 Tax=Aplysia californica TaxID=6500 RepID=A0ABM0JD07_APLCA|nr:clp protease adapter protein ClpF, chloroplastic [Aplysia californica]XP_012943411.1 clp protease adapter protein ClpF, chloroplastic [Aplysia californica]XP_035828262.1 clp protease adapter protein ClpF, chloroplastic [Aplysia californica]
MPLPLDVGVRAGMVYLVLVLAIPIQYYLSNQMSVPSTQRDANLKRLLKTFYHFKSKYLSLPSWKRWCWSWFKKAESLRTGQKFIILGKDPGKDMGETPAKDVLTYRNPEGYFAKSTEVRSYRPTDVKFRVGQVVKHKIWGYRGVIIGWDAKAHAPEEWLNKMHPPDKTRWRDMPNYSILVDTRDRGTPQSTYVPQENIEVISNYEIQHPFIWDYFDSFDGALYIMRKALRYFYPKDG